MGAIGALPKGKQTEAVKKVFDAVAEVPTVRQALVAAHGDKLPRGGRAMSVAEFLNLQP